MPSIKRSFGDTTDIITKRAKYDTVYERALARMNAEDVRVHRQRWFCVMVQVQIMNLYPQPVNVRKIESEQMGYYQSHFEYDLSTKGRYYVLQRLQDKHCYDVRFKSTWETRNLMKYLKNPPSCICPVYRPAKSYCKTFGDLYITYL